MVVNTVNISSIVYVNFYICILILNDILLLTIIFVYDFD